VCGPRVVRCGVTLAVLQTMGLYERLFERNLGLITAAEQDALRRSTVGIAGAGADGGMLAERLARFGIGGILLADPDCFEESNINRQFAANCRTLGKNKATVISTELSLINPELRVATYEKGLTSSNTKDFVKRSDVIVDEVDYLRPEVSAMLAAEARRQKKYVFMGASIGWTATVMCFSPDGQPFEEYFQYNPRTREVNLLRYVNQVPSYFPKQLAKKIVQKRAPCPSLSPSVSLTASLLCSEIVFFLLKKRSPIIVPEILVCDTFHRELRIYQGVRRGTPHRWQRHI